MFGKSVNHPKKHCGYLDGIEVGSTDKKVSISISKISFELPETCPIKRRTRVRQAKRQKN